MSEEPLSHTSQSEFTKHLGTTHIMSQRPKVLLVVTSHDKLGNTDRRTDWYLVYFPMSNHILLKTLTNYIKPEGAHPYEVLAPHVDITWASPKGG